MMTYKEGLNMSPRIIVLFFLIKHHENNYIKEIGIGQKM